jgi:limonene-1,2-epoxide hydrolase
MPTDETSRIMDAYFAALGTGRFSQFFTDDVTWTTIQNNLEVSGAQAVEAAITGLHARMADLKTRQLGVTDGMAYIEGSCAGENGARIPYCVAYDVVGGRIAAMRAYGEIAPFMPTSD